MAGASSVAAALQMPLDSRLGSMEKHAEAGAHLLRGVATLQAGLTAVAAAICACGAAPDRLRRGQDAT